MSHISYTYQESAGLDTPELITRAESVGEYRGHLEEVLASGDYTTPESSILLPSDESLAEDLRNLIKTLGDTQTFKAVLVLGIGGSSLGSLTLYTIKQGWVDAFSPRRPKLLYLESLSELAVRGVTDFLDREVTRPDELLVCVVSKSGRTVETITQYELLFAYLVQRFGDTALLRSRCVFFSDEDSPLMQYAQSHASPVQTLPPTVGGRFSLFTSSHLLSAQYGGVDINALRRGAVIGRSDSLIASVTENPALMLASVYSGWIEKGLLAHNLFIFSPELVALGNWYRQLFAESLGKNGGGMLPIVSFGSSDLHSIGQHYFGGPRNIATTFVSVAQAPSPQHAVSMTPETGALGENLAGKKLQEIQNALYMGTKESYRAHQLPFTELTLPDTGEESLGACMQMMMISVMYSARMRGISAFDQPDVEGYKELSRKHLAS